ncbi:DUF721 domain-containing protein [Lachnospiraceae bacterium OttesenSCG-928-E19]|nr:DUF721 domain-containing protein [Lachnospiraceae bacterium OttesenSCG-928-E19]
METDNKKPDLKKRYARPQTLQSAIGGLFRVFGMRASDADLARRWNEIMGDDISSIAQLVAINKTRDNKFNIAVRAANPAFALPLSYQTDEITKRINKYFGYDAVAKIQIRK